MPSATATAASAISPSTHLFPFNEFRREVFPDLHEDFIKPRWLQNKVE